MTIVSRRHLPFPCRLHTRAAASAATKEGDRREGARRAPEEWRGRRRGAAALISLHHCPCRALRRHGLARGADRIAPIGEAAAEAAV